MLRVAGVLVTSLFLVAGCGPAADEKKGTTVKGKILSNGQALESAADFSSAGGKPVVRLTVDLLDASGKFPAAPASNPTESSRSRVLRPASTR
jgi:hypothetical protein